MSQYFTNFPKWFLWGKLAIYWANDKLKKHLFNSVKTYA